MTYQNSYKKRSHLGVAKSRKIIRYFAEDLVATTTSKLLDIERETFLTDKSKMKEVKMSWEQSEGIMIAKESMKGVCANSARLFSKEFVTDN